MCSPSIGDERGIFKCSILFLNEWDIQVGSWPESKFKGDQKEWKLFNSILKVICEWICMFGEWTCLFWMVAPVPTDWICLFGDNPFRPNGCVIQRTDLSVRKGYACFNWTDVFVRKDCTRYKRNVSFNCYIKTEYHFKDHNQCNSEFIFLHLLSEYKVYSDKNPL